MDVIFLRHVLADAGMRDVVEGYAFQSVGTPELKGFDAPIELFEVRRI
jgi:class 3 adenylate cyclase